MFYVHFKTKQILEGDDETLATFFELPHVDDIDDPDRHECNCEHCTVHEEEEEYPGLDERADDEGIFTDTLEQAEMLLENEIEASEE